MYSNERPQQPQRQALPSLSQILSPENHTDFSNSYTPRTHQSPPIPPFRELRAPENPLPGLRPGQSTYYQSYQAPPPPAGLGSRDAQDASRYQRSSLTTGHPSLPLRDSQYALSSTSPHDRSMVSPQRASFPTPQMQGSSLTHDEHRRLSLAQVGSQRSAQDAYASQHQTSAGPSPRAPRVIDEQYVAGEGVCYVYEDGTRCQKYIDGEGVNPQWGVTKAGKPRKRLAQACTTCREKKIKCDPSSPKCLQCQKFNRECRFENAPRGHHHLSSNFAPNMAQPGSQEQQYEGSTPHLRESVSSHGSAKRPADVENGYAYGRPTEGSQDDGEAKKQRRGSASTSSEPTNQRSKKFKGSNFRVFRKPTASGESSSTLGQDPFTVMGMHDAPQAMDWNVDPWDFDADSANYHMSLYFEHVNLTTYCMFPQRHFIHWCQTNRKKSLDDKMVVYSLLAMGAVFSTRPERLLIIRKLLNVAEIAVQNRFGKFNLQLVQSRLVLALVHFALGNSTKAWDYCGAAIRSACGLKLNTEEGCSEYSGEKNLDYGLNGTALVECQRRTFWSAFLMDRFNGFCSGHLSIIDIDDCYLRLPMSQDMYDDQLAPLSPSPYFRNNIVDASLCKATTTSSLGAMQYLVNISALWGETLAFIYRYSNSSSETFPQRYESHYASMMIRLSEWTEKLPPHLTWSTENLDLSIRHGYIGTYISLHCLYHCTIMKLSRHLRWRTLDSQPKSLLHHNIRLAHHHAHALLEATRSLAKIDRDERLYYLSPHTFSFSTPFTGYTILTAVDILSSAGSLSSLPETIRLIDSGLEVVEELATYWNSAKGQFRLVGSRLKCLAETLAELETNGSSSPDDTSSAQRQESGKPEKKAWVLKSPLSAMYGQEDDLIYSMDRKQYLQFLDIQVDGPEEVIFVDGSDGRVGDLPPDAAYL